MASPARVSLVRVRGYALVMSLVSPRRACISQVAPAVRASAKRATRTQSAWKGTHHSWDGLTPFRLAVRQPVLERSRKVVHSKSVAQIGVGAEVMTDAKVR
jgi:hypothetical protein